MASYQLFYFLVLTSLLLLFISPCHSYSDKKHDTNGSPPVKSQKGWRKFQSPIPVAMQIPIHASEARDLISLAPQTPRKRPILVSEPTSIPVHPSETPIPVHARLAEAPVKNEASIHARLAEAPVKNEASTNARLAEAPVKIEARSAEPPIVDARDLKSAKAPIIIDARDWKSTVEPLSKQPILASEPMEPGMELASVPMEPAMELASEPMVPAMELSSEPMEPAMELASEPVIPAMELASEPMEPAME